MQNPVSVVPAVFQFESHQIRTIVKDGEPWFVANDIAETLGYVRPKDAIAQHCKCAEIFKGGKMPPLGNSPRGITIIPERDVYRLIMRSKLPAAERFEEWVVNEVLPSIRKTGSYSLPTLPAALNDPVTMRSILLTYTEKVIEQDKLIAVIQPKADVADRISMSDGYITITDAAKILKVRPRWFARYLRVERWVYQRTGHRALIPYQERITAGYMDLKYVLVPSQEDKDRAFPQAVFLPKGIAKLASIFENGVQGVVNG